MKTSLPIPKEFHSPAALAGLPEDTPILLALSGGADSVSLLHMLVTKAAQTGARIGAVHVNHGIRGPEADRDEEFCKEFTASLGVPLFVHRVSVPTLAKEWGESIETAARRARYDCFRSVMAEEKFPILVTAHNADDNLETMIHHMLRGSGLTGLCGIPQCRRFEDGFLCRPILSLPRKNILAYCHDAGLSYVTDSTNLEEDYTRNQIRARVLPALLSINEGAIEHSVRLADALRSDSLCLESMTDWFLSELCEDGSLELEKINGSPDAIVNRALMALFAYDAQGETLSSAHLSAIRALCREGRPHSSVSLPGGREAVIEERRLYFREKQTIPAVEPYEIPLSDEECVISQTNAKIVILPSQKGKNIYKNSILLRVDSAKINGELIARSRREGDRIRLGGMSKRIKKLMCDKKIPLDLRPRLPILCDNDGVLAVPLLGVRDGATPADGSDTALTIRIEL